MKTCTICAQAKTLQSFGRDVSRKSGLKEQCKACRAEARKRFVAANRDAVNARQNEFYERNRERALAAAATRYAKNKNDVLRRAAVSYRANSAPAKARASLRRAKILRQTLPLTADQRAEIVQLYALADKLTLETGIRHEVDHEIPLQGREVSGLHVPWNLQILTAEQNRAKSNRLLAVR